MNRTRKTKRANRKKEEEEQKSPGVIGKAQATTNSWWWKCHIERNSNRRFSFPIVLSINVREQNTSDDPTAHHFGVWHQLAVVTFSPAGWRYGMNMLGPEEVHFQNIQVQKLRVFGSCLSAPTKRNFEVIVLPGVRILFNYFSDSEMYVLWHGTCKLSVACGGQKREFTWQVHGIGHVVKTVASAVFHGRCQKVGRGVSFEGFCYTFRAQGIRIVGLMLLSRRTHFLRGVAFLKLELGDVLEWPVQHFVWPRLMISWQAQCFWSRVSKDEPFAEIVGVECAECW